MKKTISEQEMVLKYCKKLRREKTEFTVEVPFFHRSIDLVYLNKDNKYCAVEFKLTNWKIALKQAEDYSLWADYTYICMPKCKVSQNAKFSILDNWFWLIIFDTERGRFKKIHDPIKKPNLNGQPLMKRWFNFALANNNYGLLLTSFS